MCIRTWPTMCLKIPYHWLVPRHQHTRCRIQKWIIIFQTVFSKYWLSIRFRLSEKLLNMTVWISRDFFETIRFMMAQISQSNCNKGHEFNLTEHWIHIHLNRLIIRWRYSTRLISPSISLLPWRQHAWSGTFITNMYFAIMQEQSRCLDGK